MQVEEMWVGSSRSRSDPRVRSAAQQQTHAHASFAMKPIARIMLKMEVILQLIESARSILAL
eukprot:11619735-Alexandrium_andersonii.AAC.1